MQRIRVKGGTKSEKEVLCHTCRFGGFVRGAAESQEVRTCEQGIKVRFPVIECPEYVKKGEKTLYEMEKIAWILEGREKKFGFIKAEQWRRKYGDNERMVPE